ncbi:uncharacterized protein [Palaemon carinicauda]|uniref:uncharacterized protein n=1 Tax=Palaemon carinicauda TaxID=392227 RepID=UPI0035B5F16F
MSTGYTSIENRVLVIHLHEEGLKTGAISGKTCVKQRTVQNILKKYRVSGGKEILKVDTSPGRPQIISQRGLRVLARNIETNPILTADNPEAVAGASGRTVQQRLQKDLHYSKVKARRNPLVSAKQKDQLAFANSYKDWDLDKWRKVLWSDEASFFVADTKGKRVWRKATSYPLNPEYLSTSVKFPAYVMVWGCFGETDQRATTCLGQPLPNPPKDISRFRPQETKRGQETSWHAHKVVGQGLVSVDH